MGLDMYLDRHTSFSTYPKGAEATVTVFGGREGEAVADIQFEGVGSVTQRVKYWRKDNAIHKWFVDNVQEGEDDCGTYTLSLETLKELRDVCMEVLRDPSKVDDLLPPESGFFFGSTEVDEYYWESLKETVDAIEKEILESETTFSKHPDGVWGVYYTYHSSW